MTDGPPPVSGACSACGARYEGGGQTPREAATRTLQAFDAAGDPDCLVAGLFAGAARALDVTITSDRRDGFYEWWVFVADTPAARARLEELARPVEGG